MGLGDNHPEKEGVLVAISDLTGEIRRRLDQMKRLEELAMDASGLRVVDGVKGENVTIAQEAAAKDAAPATGPVAAS